MSTQHDAAPRSLSEVAAFQKNLIPVNIPEIYALNPMLLSIASDENIRKGVIAFRDCLLSLLDRLISDGHLYAKPSSKGDYPLLGYISNLLLDTGYYGKLAESGDSLLITELPSCTASIDGNGKKKSPLIPVSGQIECLRLLTRCGFVFAGIDLDAKKPDISQCSAVSYPSNPHLLTGLKAMAVAELELRTTRRYSNDNNLLRCDYRMLKAEASDMSDVLKDFLYPLPEKTQEFALKLHRRYTDKGLTCINTRLGIISFAYVYTGNSRRAMSERDIYAKRVWEFSYSIKNGYCLFVRAKKTDKYADIIEKFPAFLQEKIAQGYGCYKKLGRERCQVDCQGIGLPLDDSILDISGDIETWLDNEMPGALRK